MSDYPDKEAVIASAPLKVQALKSFANDSNINSAIYLDQVDVIIVFKCQYHINQSDSSKER